MFVWTNNADIYVGEIITTVLFCEEHGTRSSP